LDGAAEEEEEVKKKVCECQRSFVFTSMELGEAGGDVPLPSTIESELADRL
jgi:hypothetical protein